MLPARQSTHTKIHTHTDYWLTRNHSNHRWYTIIDLTTGQSSTLTRYCYRPCTTHSPTNVLRLIHWGDNNKWGAVDWHGKGRRCVMLSKLLYFLLFVPAPYANFGIPPFTSIGPEGTSLAFTGDCYSAEENPGHHRVILSCGKDHHHAIHSFH